MKRRKVCVVSGSRADVNYLLSPMRGIAADPSLSLQLVVTGSHLSPSHGLSVRSLEAEGFAIHEQVDMLLVGDTPVCTAKSTGLGVIGMSDAFQRLSPDLVMVLGDRFEIFAAVQSAFLMGIPVAHLGGGDTTEGAFDDGLRHAITKLAHWHFPTNSQAASRLIQMGESPDRVHTIGSTSLDLLAGFSPLSRDEFSAVTGWKWQRRNFLVTFHPATLAEQSPEEQIDVVLQGLPDDAGILFTGTNADPGGIRIQERIAAFVAKEPERRALVPHLGCQRYFSAICLMDAVVGNSSSGLYEVPSFGKPTINIGSRQEGRLRASSVFDCPLDARQISTTLAKAMSQDWKGTINPYGDGHAAERILQILTGREDWRSLIQKRFHS